MQTHMVSTWCHTVRAALHNNTVWFIWRLPLSFFLLYFTPNSLFSLILSILSPSLYSTFIISFYISSPLLSLTPRSKLPISIIKVWVETRSITSQQQHIRVPGQRVVENCTGQSTGMEREMLLLICLPPPLNLILLPSLLPSLLTSLPLLLPFFLYSSHPHIFISPLICIFYSHFSLRFFIPLLSFLLYSYSFSFSFSSCRI